MHNTSCKQSKWALLLLPFITLLFSLVTSYTFAQPDGKKLFKSNCSSCHTASDAKMIGPGLKGVKSRWPEQTKLHAWIRNSGEFLKTGDAYATGLYEQYNKSVMTPFPGLTDEEINAIVDYVDVGEAKAGPATAGTTATGDAAEQDNKSDNLFLLVALAIIFIIIISVLGGVNRSMQNVINERKGIPPLEEQTTIESIKSFLGKYKAITTILIITILVWGLKQTWDGLMKVGVYQGYKPEQPIKFSHKIHAGDNAINCVYCHSGAEKSKHAGIPSANVCMNCHKGISEGTQTGTKEIAKIYEALDYNKETLTYGDKTKPLVWTKVHNLPDHVYFNHSQHVKVGGVPCQKCHGEVEKMDVAEQHAPLTMGWCIDCHRETNVQAEGNGYYDELKRRLRERDEPADVGTYKGQGEGDMAKYGPKKDRTGYKGDGKTNIHAQFTVQDIGGLECAKCHY